LLFCFGGGGCSGQWFLYFFFLEISVEISGEKKKKGKEWRINNTTNKIKKKTHIIFFPFVGEVGGKDMMLRIFVVGIMCLWARTKHNHKYIYFFVFGSLN
jgi:hypothetical protein